MSKIEFDSSTNLPALPTGYRWRVGLDDTYTHIENDYAVFLEEKGSYTKFFRTYERWYVVSRIIIYNLNERVGGKRPPLILTDKLIRDASIEAYGKWIKEGDEHFLRHEQQRKSREAETKFFGTYPPKTL